MAQRFDVATRLAEGREAVARTQLYVSACALRGYRHPELTGYPAQVLDWYDGDDGMDLGALDDDCAGLQAAAVEAGDVLDRQRAQLDELAGAWRGAGADAAAGLVGRHCATAERLVTGLGAAAHACTVLRDALWRVIEDKVTAAVQIDERTAAQRPVWLAAAGDATAGQQQADRVIDEQLKPYVDNDIRTDWLGAMRAARTAIADAYHGAAVAAAPPVGVVFPIPADLAPRYQPPDPPRLAPPVAPAPPAAAPWASAPDTPPEPTASAETPAWADPLADAALPSGLGLPGGGLSGLGGILPRIADTLNGLLATPDDYTDTAPDAALNERDEPADEPVEEPIEELEDAADGTDDPDPAAEQTAEQAAMESDPAPEPAADPAAELGPENPETPETPETEETSQQDPDATPCQIAADELAQAGQ